MARTPEDQQALDDLFHSIVPHPEHAVAAEELLRKGANIDGIHSRYLLKATPLFHAMENRDLRSFRWLLAHGADPDLVPAHTQQTLLMLLVNQNYPLEYVEALLDAKPDLERRNPEGNTVLLQALEDEKDALAHLLLTKGANPLAPNDQTGMLPLILAVICNCRRSVQEMIRLGVPLDSVAILPYDPELPADAMGAAAWRPNLEIMEDLYAAALPVDGYATPPLHLAIDRGRNSSVKWLLEHGAQTEIRFNGETAIIRAARRGPSVAFAELLAHAADVAPLGSPSVVDIILEHIRNPSHPNSTKGSDLSREYRYHYRSQCLALYTKLRAMNIAVADGDPDFVEVRNAKSDIPEFFGDDGGATLFLRKLASWHQLHRFFTPSDWTDREDEAGLLYRRMHAALPRHARAQLQAIDMSWVKPDPPSLDHWQRRAKKPVLPPVAR